MARVKKSANNDNRRRSQRILGSGSRLPTRKQNENDVIDIDSEVCNKHVEMQY